jgi:glycosyltransferase involved in cell wall biosynthesis
MKDIPVLSIVIPVYNEEKAIGEVLDKLITQRQEKNWEILVVDDGSNDQTARIILNYPVRLIRHHGNRGYGAALKSGIRHSTSDFIVIMDGDGQHNPQDIRRLLREVENSDLVAGARQKKSHSPLWRMPGKWFLSLLANYLMRQRIPDLNCGFRIYRREILMPYLPICPDGFSFSMTSLFAFLSDNYRVTYIPIETGNRKGRSSVTLFTGFETILLILRIITLFNPLRIFIPISAGCILFGGSLFFIYYFFHDRGSVSALVLLLIGVQFFFFGLVSDQLARFRREIIQK